MSASSDPNRPVRTLRHRHLKVAIWENQTSNGVMYTATVTRSFKQEDGWKDTQSFRYDDLPIVAKLLNDAHTVISGLIEKSETPAPKAASKR